MVANTIHTKRLGLFVAAQALDFKSNTQTANMEENKKKKR